MIKVRERQTTKCLGSSSYIYIFFYLKVLNIVILSSCYNKYDVNRVDAHGPCGYSAAEMCGGALTNSVVIGRKGQTV